MAKYTEAQGLPYIDYTCKPGDDLRKYLPVRAYKTREQRLRFAENNPAKAYEEATGEKLKKDARGLVRVAFGHYGMEMDINPEPNTNNSNRVRTMEEKVVKEPSYLEIHQYYLKEGKLVKLLGDKEVLSDEFSKRAVEKLCSLEKVKDKVEYRGDFWLSLGRDKKCKRPYRVYSCADKFICLDLSNGNIFFHNNVKDREPVENKFQFGSIIFKKEDNAYKLR